MITGVVLAAGASTRMGAQKLLLRLGEETVIARTVRQLSESGVAEVLVVVGFEHEKVAAAVEGFGCRVTVNPDFETGMGSSFRTAVSAMEGSSAAMFALADQPFVTSDEYRRLIDTYRAHPPGIVCVRYGDVTAPPHLFDRQFFPELAALEHGARPVLQRHRDKTVVLQFPPEMLLDIDTPEDYERAIERLSAGR
jgi:molybdenum cofactor cytidylyltransferase